MKKPISSSSLERRGRGRGGVLGGGNLFWLALLVVLIAPSSRQNQVSAAGLAVPDNLREFYNALRNGTAGGGDDDDDGPRRCRHELATGFYDTDNASGTTSYCADSAENPSIIWLASSKKKNQKGSSTATGSLTNMDIDCDGVQGGPQDDGRCSMGRSPDYQDATAFRDVVRSYNVANVTDLNTYVHPYVVFGNSGSKRGWKTFDPEKHGVRPLSVMAVVCGGAGREKLVFGVWGDTNGDDGDKPVVGEASISLATACNGRSMTGDYGYDENDVLYLAFTGDEAVPGAKGADWGASDYEAFHKSIEDLGNKLVAKVKVDSLTDSSGAAGRHRVDLGVVVVVLGVLCGMWVAI